ncbi:serine hydrolase [Acutalibacter muris]|uniref:Serine hydrolase n=1 Tax=Acutalibacter muris TaxID=1796620 RepID=A0A1Z2XUY7_9FIRM|nr:serine hydrolase [Acutalibacter muris]ANU54518.1 serine hydrolase [Hungateiclostridiaceae bacterium KB18]ASB42255.1 serine hydrolase [Acutalibacter muris]QQR31534.1 serine hydrolase [Acutalibacter muris]
MLELAPFIEAATPLRALGVVVSQNGRETARHTWEGACRRNIYSASKSFTSAAVGIAIKEGLLSLEERLVDAFSEELPVTVLENLRKATVRDLLTMCLGQPKAFLMGEDRPYYPEKNWVRLALAQPFSYEPGTKFVYNNVGPYLAGILVQRRAGCDLVHYLMPRLFEPMGLRLPTWETDPLGNTFGAGGLFLTMDELHKFGLLYLQKGNWQGRQLVPESWVRESTSKQAENGGHGYGYLFWGGEHGSFRADGKYGQFSILMRDKNAVVTIVAESREADKLLAAVFEHIYCRL